MNDLEKGREKESEVKLRRTWYKDFEKTHSIGGLLKEEKRSVDFDYREKYAAPTGLAEIKGLDRRFHLRDI